MIYRRCVGKWLEKTTFKVNIAYLLNKSVNAHMELRAIPGKPIDLFSTETGLSSGLHCKPWNGINPVTAYKMWGATK
jgi:hypothetical protein